MMRRSWPNLEVVPVHGPQISRQAQDAKGYDALVGTGTCVWIGNGIPGVNRTAPG